MPRKLTVAIVLLAGALAALPGAYARPTADPGITGNSILLGGTAPLTGVAASYASVARGAEAYFKHINATRRGVNGRRINYKYYDDAYNESQTVQQTIRLVQQDKVFAIFNSLGTEHNLAIRSILNRARVPQVFIGSGATTFGRDHKRYPMTIGYLPSYVGEARVYARHILKTKPNAKIAILYQDDSYGRDLLDGFRKSMGPKRSNIVSTQSYDPLTATDVSSQVSRLKASGATIFMLIATPRQAIQAMVAAHRLGWRKQLYVNQVGSATNVMRIVEATAGRAAVQNAITLAAYKDPNSPQFRNDAGMKLYKSIMKRYLPRSDVNDVFHVYSMAVAHTMVAALRRAGRNLTRAGLLRAVNNLHATGNPFLLPGITLRTTPNDAFPIEQGQLQRWRGGHYVPLGKLQSTRP